MIDGNRNTAYITNTTADTVYRIAAVSDNGVFLVRYPIQPKSTPKANIPICGNTNIAAIDPAVVSISSI